MLPLPKKVIIFIKGSFINIFIIICQSTQSVCFVLKNEGFIMKKFFSAILVIVLVISCSFVLSNGNFSFIPLKTITHEEAVQFADEIKELCNAEKYDPSNCLLIGSEKEIEDENAVEIIKGVNNLYVVQYENEEQAQDALDYYNSQPYVSYAERDGQGVVTACDEEETNIASSDLNVKCQSTVNCNIDDAVKLVQNEGYDFKETHIAIIDSGVAINAVTQDRFAGGYSYLDGYAADGTEDLNKHGTRVCGTIINNTLDNVKIHSYQILNDKGKNFDFNKTVSAIYLAVADGCKVINCSFSGPEFAARAEAERYATQRGCIFVTAAGNDTSDNVCYPARLDESISVGAVNCGNKKASFTNYGKYVDIYATGSSVMALSTNGEEKYYWSGTSASTPVISSVVMLLLTVKPDLTVFDIKSLLVETGTCLYDSDSCFEGELTVDAYAAVKKLTGKELEKVKLDYAVAENTDTGYSDITFYCDEDAIVYYNCVDNLFFPFSGDYLTKYSSAKNGQTIHLNKNCEVKAVAYAPEKAKSEFVMFTAPDYQNESGFLLSKSNQTQQYNKVSQYHLKDSIVELNAYIDNVQVQEIGDYCFMGNKDIEVIILPESVKKIGDFAFANCPNLKAVFALGVEACGVMTFHNCRSLQSVCMPKVNSANTGMFKNCCSLTHLQLGKLERICNQAFYCCESLSFLNVSDAVNSFSKNTFDHCTSLVINANGGKYVTDYAKEKGIEIGEYAKAAACAHNHKTDLKRLDYTCTTDGYAFYKCLDCQKYITEYDYMPGHSYEITVFEPTCVNMGYTEYICSVCKDTYRDSYVDCIEHKWQMIREIQPTWETNGERCYRCIDCGLEYTEMMLCLSSYHTVSGMVVLGEMNETSDTGCYALQNVKVYIGDKLQGETDENGNFSFEMINGSYVLELKYDFGINVQIPCIIDNDDVSFGQIEMIGVDFVNDGYINAKDYAKLLRHINQIETDNMYAYDLNNDGKVDACDLEIFKAYLFHFSETYAYE